MKVAFFHGLESPAISDKSEYLQSAFPDAYVPAMDYNKSGLFDEVLKEVKKRNIDLLIGSSMGGWFAYCISTLTGIPTVLFNPAVHSRSVEPGVYRGSSRANHTVVLGKSDDLIDPQKTKNWFKTDGVGSVNYKMESNGHRTPMSVFRKYLSAYESQSAQKHVMLFEQWLMEKKPAGAPEWKDSDAPDAEGRFRDLGIKDLAAWLIKSRKKDLKKISGSLTQQVVFNRKEDPEYAEKMEKVRQEVYKQLGRTDLMESVKDGVVTCDKCGWHWDIVTGGDDPYVCHKCNTDNSPIIEKESPFSKETLKAYQKDFEDGKEIPFGIKSSLIAQGLIPRQGGADKGKKVKSKEYK